MESDSVSQVSNSMELLGKLILEELKFIRQDMKEEVRKLGDKLQNFIDTKYEYLERSEQESDRHASDLEGDDNDLDLHNCSDVQDSDGAYSSIKVKCEVNENEESFPQTTLEVQECYTDIEVPLMATFESPEMEQIHEENHSKIESQELNNKEGVVTDATGGGQEGYEAKKEDVSVYLQMMRSKDFERNSLVFKEQHKSLNDNDKNGVIKCKPLNSSLLSSTKSENHTSERNENNKPSTTGLTRPCNESSVNSSADQAIKEPFQCAVCDKSFRQAEILTRHMKCHIGAPSSYQQKLYNIQQNNLNDQIKQITDKNFLHRCEICGKLFNLKSGLVMHRNTHTTFKSLHPSVMSMSTELPEHLRKNLVMVNGKKMYKCNICGKIFIYTSQAFQRHMMIHTGERPFQCKFCKKGFIRSANLKMHIRTHTGEKPYECKLCKKSFRVSWYLKKHIVSSHDHDAFM